MHSLTFVQKSAVLLLLHWLPLQHMDLAKAVGQGRDAIIHHYLSQGELGLRCPLAENESVRHPGSEAAPPH